MWLLRNFILCLCIRFRPVLYFYQTVLLQSTFIHLSNTYLILILCQHCSKCFTNIISFNAYNNSVSWVLLLAPHIFPSPLHDFTPFFTKQNRLKLLQVNTTALSPKLIYCFDVLNSFVSLVLLLFLCSSLVNWLVYLSVALQFASQLLTIIRGKLASTY